VPEKLGVFKFLSASVVFSGGRWGGSGIYSHEGLLQ